MTQIPLSDAAVAAVQETLRGLTETDSKLDALCGELQHCKVPFDVEKMRMALRMLDVPYADLARVLREHFDALAERKARLMA